MPLDGTYEPSAWDMIAEQVRQYEESAGTEGNALEGKPCVILWTRGRHSGTVRKTPLMRVTDGSRYCVVASLGGAPKHPVWYLNLVADPHVSLQDGPEVKDYVARTVEGAERDEWWKRSADAWPAYNDYKTKTDREIPVVVLDPA